MAVSERQKHQKHEKAREDHEKDRDKHEKELRELQAANVERRVTHQASEVHGEVEGVEVHALGGVVYVKTSGEVKLDQNGVFGLIQKLQAAFQAVS